MQRGIPGGKRVRGGGGGYVVGDRHAMKIGGAGRGGARGGERRGDRIDRGKKKKAQNTNLSSPEKLRACGSKRGWEVRIAQTSVETYATF